jgi:hypothetical protein
LPPPFSLYIKYPDGNMNLKMLMDSYRRNARKSLVTKYGCTRGSGARKVWRLRDYPESGSRGLYFISVT